MHSIVLASSSSYRTLLLSRLRLPFTAISANVDETPLHGELPQALCDRLSRAKAMAVSQLNPESIVIGSDQVASLSGELLGKPGHRDGACVQLKRCSGKQVDFFTGLCVQLKNTQLFHLSHTQVKFRALSDDEIIQYIDFEKPWDCAGSFKAEGLGICLFESITSSDPTDLIGLPLIALNRLLLQLGINPIKHERPGQESSRQSPETDR